MHEERARALGLDFGKGPRSANPTQSISTQEIFRVMIAQEFRAGRLNRTTADRMFRFASDYGVSRAEAQAMLEQCMNNHAAVEAPDPLKTSPERVAFPKRHSSWPIVIMLALIAWTCIVFEQIWHLAAK